MQEVSRPSSSITDIALKMCLDKNPQFRNSYFARPIIEQCLYETFLLEQAIPRSLLAITQVEAIKTKALWVPSAPGTYYLPFKDDRYMYYPWSKFMDRHRIQYAFSLMRTLTEISIGKELDEIKNPVGTREAIFNHGPLLIYNGTKEENTALIVALEQEQNFIPQEKVRIINDPTIKETSDQIRTFNLPEGLEEGGIIGLVAHAAQTMRFLHMLSHPANSFRGPDKLRLFPISSPLGGEIEYPALEASKMPYYILEAQRADFNIFPNNLIKL